MKIIGAGLAGLLAASYFTEAEVYDIKPLHDIKHHGVLRFRTEEVSLMTSIKFKQITVRKGVYFNGHVYEEDCPIAAANQYSLKVTGQLSDRSIFNLRPEKRFIAPLDFQETLQKRIVDRFHIRPLTSQILNSGQPIINTAPLSAAIKAAHMNCAFDFESNHRPIYVTEIPLQVQSDIHQTIYFPESNLPFYRCTISGNMFIAESAADISIDQGDLHRAAQCFGLGLNVLDIAHLHRYRHSVGKIYGLEPGLRKSIIKKMTDDFNLYSLGRFGCWKEGLLLDEIPKDLELIKKYMSISEYDRALAYLKG